MNRYLESQIREDLSEKMVFLGGPRQVGKTTLSLQILGAENESHPAYLSWDNPAVKRALLKGLLPANQPLLVFDEIHKYKNWRNLIKGIYDTNKSKVSCLVTGSARLDYFRRGGDSLQGRYHFLRLHPLSLKELGLKVTKSDMDHLLKFGGFPEPFLRGSAKHWSRWQLERRSRVIQEDLVSLETVKEISSLDLLCDLLPSRVGGILSLNSLREDLSVAFMTVDRWVGILENLYYCFRIQPFGVSKLRAAKKEKKIYLWDWSVVENAGAKFENFIASQLLKHCHFVQDTEGAKMELRFLRDSEKREIDFVVIKNNKPEFAVECKAGDKDISRHIEYFSQRTTIPYFYQVHLGTSHFMKATMRAEVIPAINFLQRLKA